MEGISTAVFYLVGGVREGKIVVGPERDEIPPTPVWKNLVESHDVVGFGTIFYKAMNRRCIFMGHLVKRIW